MVNPDSIRLSLHGQAFVKSAEVFVWAIAHKMVEALFLAGHADVVLDATNITPQYRNEWLSDDWECRFLYFDTPKEECIRRAISSDKEYLIPVIERMNDSLDLTGCQIETIS